MTPKPLRIGLVGCGAIARQVHLPLLYGRSDVRVTALAERNVDLLTETAQKFGDAGVYATIEEMLGGGVDLDAVIVTLPTGLHASAACAVLDAGLHLYLEKPLATSLEDAAAVVESWHRAGTVGMMGFNCRANPLVLELRDLMQGGRAGGLHHLRTVFSIAARDMPEWKQHRSSGGGALLDLGAHHIDLIRFVTNREICGVRATIQSRVTEHDTALLELELDGGVTAHAFFSLAGAELEHIEVHGDQARLAVSRFTSLAVDIAENPGRGAGPLGQVLRRAGGLRHIGRAFRTRRAPWREPGYAVLLDRFIGAARSGASGYGPDLADGFACTAVVAAAERSAVSGRIEAPVALASFIPKEVALATPFSAGEPTDTPHLSVVLVTPDSYAEIETTVRSLRAQTIAGRVELLIAAPSALRVQIPGDHTADLQGVRVIEVGPLTSLAAARATTMRHATAPFVAFAEDHSFPEPGWAAALVAAHAKGYTGVAPQMMNGNPETGLSWAAMFLHFGGAVEPGNGFEADYPAASHNMSYRRDALLELGDGLGELMLAELFLHEALRARGHRLWVEPTAGTRHMNVSRLFPALRHAWFGGRLYGGLRSNFGAWTFPRRVLYAGGSPLIPLMRLRRVVPEMRRTNAGRAALSRALVPMAAILAVHALGEAFGYLFGLGNTKVAYSEFETRRDRHVRPAERALWG